jgi:hypothetical protein
MKCPNCENQNIEISLYSGGFVSNETPVKECPDCHHVWTCDAERTIRVISQGFEQDFDLAA